MIESEALVALGLAAAPACVAAVACGLAARRTRGANRASWLILCGSAVAWGLGVLLRLLAGGDGLAEWPAFAAFLAAPLLALVGVLRLHGAPTRFWGQARTVVDGLIVAGSALFVAWSLGLDDLYAGRADAGGGFALAEALADLVVAAAVLVMVTRCRPDARRRLGLIAGGFAALTLASAALAYVALGGTAAAAPALYLGWAAGWLLVAIAAMYRRHEHGHELEPGLPGHASLFVPSIPFALGVVAAAAAGVRGEFDGFLVWTGAAVIVLIVMRQVLALVENIFYWRDLEAKVEAHTNELERSEARFRSVVQNASDAIAVLAPDGSIQYASPSVQAVLGYEPAEFYGLDLSGLLHPDDAPRVLAIARELAKPGGATRSAEFRVLHHDRGWRHVEAIASNLTDEPAIGAYVVNARDVTARTQLEGQLAQGALRDPLTGLANRALFVDRVDHALRRSMRDESLTAVLFCDLDDFKNVNDSFGHAAGDELLRAVATRLAESVRPGDTVSRLGGDEFTILVEGMGDALEAARIADRIQVALAAPFEVAGKEIVVRISIGISTSDTAGDSVSELMHTADVAMYTAKERGKGIYEVFGPSMHAALIDRLQLERDFGKALDNDQFELVYQPIVSLKTGRIRGAEALLRWRHPERGLLVPDGFIQLAEETGQIIAIGRWALRQACAQAREWQQLFRSAPPVTMSVNLSARQLRDPGLIEAVRAALGESMLNPSLLVLEITEHMLVEENAAAVERLRDLRELGVKAAVDDFGTGYSSLNDLRRLPLDILKIDREFVHEIVPGSSGAAFAEAIVAMSHSLGLTAIAEGIERAEQAEELERMGCDLAQGFRFAVPAGPDRIAELLATGGLVEPDAPSEAPAPRSAPRSDPGS